VPLHIEERDAATIGFYDLVATRWQLISLMRYLGGLWHDNFFLQLWWF